MNSELLLKGFEVELFTGRLDGEHVGIAATVAQDLPEFVKEPDNRNLEYITLPETQYSPLKEALLMPRRTLRNWLSLRDLTLLPGSTLSLGDSKQFFRSDQSNAYHDFIEKTYGSRVVTASIHINLGIEDPSLLFAALRLIRCEAALFLALSASSPFLDGASTGAHSQRWLQFPLTPEKVPFFLDHSHYVKWVETQLASGAMLNERHLWTSVRPNGNRRPYLVNRLELRICDLITDCDLLLAVTSLLELRVLRIARNLKEVDPLKVSRLTPNELSNLSDLNDIASAKSSLDATLHHWKDGNPIVCRDWISELLEEVKPLAVELGMLKNLARIDDVLNKGNQAMQWRQSHAEGQSVKSIVRRSIAQMEVQERNISEAEALQG